MISEEIKTGLGTKTYTGVVPKIAGVLAHVDIQVVLPLGDVSTLSAHEVLVIGMGQHVLGQVAHIAAREVTQLTLVRLLSYRGNHCKCLVTSLQFGKEKCYLSSKTDSAVSYCHRACTQIVPVSLSSAVLNGSELFF